MSSQQNSKISALAVNHVGISVPNLEEAVSWYKNYLGFQDLKPPKHFKRDQSIARSEDQHIFRIYGEPFSEAKVAYLSTGNDVAFEIFEFIDPKSELGAEFGHKTYTRAGCYHVALTHPDPVAFTNSLVEAGAVKIGSPAHLASGDMVAYVQDPWGMVLEFCSRAFVDLVVGT